MKPSRTDLKRLAGNSISVEITEAIIRELYSDTISPIKHFELFAGIGAFSKAFRNLKIPHELLGFSEIDPVASAVFKDLYGGRNFGSITKLKKLNTGQIDLLTGGFPCQDISRAGNNLGIVRNKTRSGLMYDMMRVVHYNSPKVVIAENVADLLTPRHKPQLDVYLDYMASRGYTTSYRKVSANHLGSVQGRERVIIVSCLDGTKFNFDNLKLKQPKSLRDTIDYELDNMSVLKRVTGASSEAVILGTIDGERVKVVKRPYIKRKHYYQLENNKSEFTTQAWRIYPPDTLKFATIGTRCDVRIGHLIDENTFIYRAITPLEGWLLMGFTRDDYILAKHTEIKER